MINSPSEVKVKWSTCGRQLARGGDVDYAHLLPVNHNDSNTITSIEGHHDQHLLLNKQQQQNDSNDTEIDQSGNGSAPDDSVPLHSHSFHHHSRGLSQDEIRQRRVVMKWLAVKYSNDLVHGSWWFVYGSIVATVSPLIVLLGQIIFGHNDENISAFEASATWLLLIASGVFFTFGSFAFVRAFEDPLPPPICNCMSLLSDEMLGAIAFSLGTAPYVPYFLIYLSREPDSFVYAVCAVLASLCFVGSLLFAAAYLPSCGNMAPKHVTKSIFQWIFGHQHWIIMHVQTDWLAGTWAVLITSVEMCILSIGMLVYTVFFAWNDKEILIYSVSVLDTLLFSIGSAFFVAGSYPLDLTQCYRSIDSGLSHEIHELEPHEIDMQTGFIDDL